MALGGVNVAGVMKSDIEKLQQNINDLIRQTENTGGTVTTGTVMAKLNSMLNNFENGNGLKIKSLQWGQLTEKIGQELSGGNTEYRDITINSVDKMKSIVFQYTNLMRTGQYDVRNATMYLANDTVLRQMSANTAKSGFNYFPQTVYYILEFK